MDLEWDKQFDDHRKRIKEVAKLVYENCSQDPELLAGLLEGCRKVVKESVSVKSEASKVAAVTQNTISEVDGCDDLKKVNVNEIYDRESQKEVEIPTFNYEQEFDAFVSSLSRNDDEGFVVSQVASVAVDPWLKTPIQVPMKSKKCGHLYDKGSIQIVLKKKPEFKCPYIGCKVRLRLADLEEE